MKDKKQMIEEMKAIIKPYIQDQEAFENLHENTDFINDLKVNSANLVDIVLDIEDKYGIEIDNESMENLFNVKAALDIVNDKVNHSASSTEFEDK